MAERRVEEEGVDKGGPEVHERGDLVAELVRAPGEPGEDRCLRRPRDGERRPRKEIGEANCDEGEPGGAEQQAEIAAELPWEEQSRCRSVDDSDRDQRPALGARVE